MKYLDLNLPFPAANLACDEALLDLAEEGSGGEVLRFFASATYFVVVGYANAIDREVNEPACASDSLEILRRCSGGGTVVQGPGCLNYTLVLSITERSELNTIASTNQFIMERQRAALENLLDKPVRIAGHTDLALDNLKFSGNAQRRRRNFCLFHGSILLDFELPLIERYLRMPSKEPDYRKNRAHREFLTNLHRSEADVKLALRTAWDADELLEATPVLHQATTQLVNTKYSLPGWNRKF